MRRLSWFAQLLVLIGAKPKPRHHYPREWKRKFKKAYAQAKFAYKKVYGHRPKEEYVTVRMRKCANQTSTRMWYWPTSYSNGGVTSGTYSRDVVHVGVGPQGQIDDDVLLHILTHELMHHFEETNGHGNGHNPALKPYIPIWR